MTAQLINQRLPGGTLIYDRRISRYRSSSDGSPIDAQVVRDILGSERSSLENELNSIADRLVRGSIGIADFQGSVGQAIKDSSINVLTFAAGGEENLRSSAVRRQYFRQLGLNLESVFDKLISLSEQVITENITEAVFRDRSSRFALEIFPVYSRTETLRLMSEQGFNEARRSVDPTIKHCPQCPEYDTGGRYLPIDLVVPVGHRCYCGGRCHCRVDFRFNPALPQIGIAQIENFVATTVGQTLI